MGRVRKPHLLRATHPPESYASLLAALRAAGQRAGWLQLEAPSPIPPSLQSAVSVGALRAVAVGEGRSTAVKALKGEAVLRDLLREHFRGCVLVLVQGEIDLPSLTPCDGAWRIGEAEVSLTDRELIAELQKPYGAKNSRLGGVTAVKQPPMGMKP